MRIFARLVHSAARGLPMLLLLTVLSACQAPVKQVDTRSQVYRAETAAAQGQYRDAAQIYMELAARDAGTQADHWRLLAAREWLNDDNLVAAVAALESIAGPMDRDDYALWTILGARVALTRGKPAEALQTLEESPLPSATLAAQFYRIKGMALLGLGRVEQAILAFGEEQTWANNAQELLASQQLLLDQLQARARKGALPDSSLDPVAQGWLDLARLSSVASTDSPALLAGLRNWRLANPQHPAVTGVVAALIERHRGANSYPIQVALLLPLSGRERAYGEAVRDGFLAAYLNSPNKNLLPLVRIYDTQLQSSVATYREAIREGADMVVGPLLKQNVTELIGVANGEVPILALNRGNVGGYTPPAFYQFALDPAEEAREIARGALADGYTRAIALVPSTGWGQRILESFTSELVDNGGQLLASTAYDPGEQDYSSAITRALNLDQSKERFSRLSDLLGMYPEFEPRRREDADFVFIAAYPEQGRLLRPQLKFHYAAKLPVYATSAIYQADAMANNDLDGLQFADMPWQLSMTKETGGLRQKVASAFPGLEENQPRLLAMGVDAFRLLPWLYNQQTNLQLAGATGLLGMTADGVIYRKLQWARFRSGEPRISKPKVLYPAPGVTGRP
ncbi:MAG: penicillin-binding protein activator [Chromatiales bacterium]|nr:penicillin-binding protein activator [Chromatiales bacterium]